MSEVSTPVEKSTWASKFSALGPGIVMASAAVGGSHIIASTQAGAIYGWELVSIVTSALSILNPAASIASRTEPKSSHAV